MKIWRSLSLLSFVFLVLVSCRGQRSERPPVHFNPNFDFQSKFKAQSFSWDPPSGTVAWGDRTSFSHEETRKEYEKESPEYYTGLDSAGRFVSKAPVEVNEALLLRGQERFDIYCAVCHDRAGTRKGMVVKRGFTPPPFLADDRLSAMTDGEVFSIISHGVRTMPAYNKQVSEADRWAIVLYVRALQKMWRASEGNVPSEMRDRIE